jgi:hypothetical protein
VFELQARHKMVLEIGSMIKPVLLVLAISDSTQIRFCSRTALIHHSSAQVFRFTSYSRQATLTPTPINTWDGNT